MSGADQSSASILASGLLIATLFMAALFLALRFGFAELIEKAPCCALVRLMGWAGASHVEGLNQALMDLLSGAVARCAFRLLASGFVAAGRNRSDGWRSSFSGSDVDLGALAL